MGVNIRNSKSEILFTIDDEKITKNKVSLNLFGRGTEYFVKEINENFYRLFEHFASKKSPKNPLIGQVWYSKKGSNILETRGTGLNYNASPYIKLNNSNISIRNRRGLTLVIIDKNKRTKFIGYYDLYGSNAARNQLANKLKSIKNDELFVLVSYDAIGTNTNLTRQMNSMKSKVWNKVKRSWRYPYTAIGTGFFGIIAEDLKGYNERKHAYAQISFESILPEEGMGYHTRLFNKNDRNDNLLVWNGQYWDSNALKLSNKSLSELRTFILRNVDLSVKLDKSGGTISGSAKFNGYLKIGNNIVPSGNEIQDLGVYNRRIKTIHLSKNNSIYMGEGKQFNKNSFVYTVEKDDDDVSHVPPGSLILNRVSGSAVVKKVNYVKNSSNTTFRGLAQDKKYGVEIGGNNYNYYGDKGIWMGSWWHGKIQKINIPTPGNSKYFGNCRPGGRSSGASDSTRGLSFYQGWTNSIQYITIATPMNANDFGSMQKGAWNSSTSDGTKAIIMGGGWYHEIHSVTFATPMNSIYFGYVNNSIQWGAAVSDGVKGIFDRGDHGCRNQIFQYVTISTPMNSIYFGKMQRSRGSTGATSNSTYGVWTGGWPCSGTINDIERLTLKTPSNSKHFGNLMYSRHTARPISNDSRAVIDSGNSYRTTLEMLSYANGGSTSKFGDTGTALKYGAGFSGN